MKIEVKVPDSNYTGTVVKISNVIPLENCDAIQHTKIFGNAVIVSKDVQIGDVGVFFPVECRLSPAYLYSNSLYRHKDRNADQEKAGFFEDSGRVKCVKLRGHRSEGVFMPLESFRYLGLVDLREGDTFDHIDGQEVCRKYTLAKQQGKGNKNQKAKQHKVSKLIPNQFRFHISTGHLGKGVYGLSHGDIVSITSKLHGTSIVVANVLTKKKLALASRFLRFLGFPIQDTEYSNIYSSRKVVKNDNLCSNPSGFYSEDIWGVVNEEIKDKVAKGMTIYAEVVGYLPNGKGIQGGYDYGCQPGDHETYVYRITTTNADGDVYEWSMWQIQEWCRQNDIKAVPLLYYGTIENWLKAIRGKGMVGIEHWHDMLVDELSDEYLERDCRICRNKVPDEGIVVRRECLDIDVLKHKSFAFKQRETKMLDKGEEDIEESDGG